MDNQYKNPSNIYCPQNCLEVRDWWSPTCIGTDTCISISFRQSWQVPRFHRCDDFFITRQYIWNFIFNWQISTFPCFQSQHRTKAKRWEVPESSLQGEWETHLCWGTQSYVICIMIVHSCCCLASKGHCQCLQSTLDNFATFNLTNWLLELFTKNAFFRHFGGFQAGYRPN